MRSSLMVSLVAALTAGTLFTGCSTTSRLAGNAYRLLPFTERPTKEVTQGVSVKNTKNLSMKMKLTPIPVSLSDARQVDVKIRLENTSKRFVQLKFPTTQRIEILVRAEDGSLVTQWSEDRSFDPTPSYLGINPGEHVEYETTIPTRDLSAGKAYTVTAFFPNFEELKAEQTIVPEA